MTMWGKLRLIILYFIILCDFLGYALYLWKALFWTERNMDPGGAWMFLYVDCDCWVEMIFQEQIAAGKPLSS